jgi:hypothetical protein
MKPSSSKTTKATSGKKRGHEEAAGSAAGTSPPVSPPRPDPNREWKKSKAKTEDLLALLNSGFIREKEVDMWRAAAGDPYPMEKNPDEIPMFARFTERGLSLPASDFFKGLMGYYDIEYLNLNPNRIFHTAVFVHFCDAVHLEDEAVAVQDHEGHRREEEGPRRGRRICRRGSTADVSTAARYKPRVEEVEDEDRRFASPPQQQIHP